MLTKTEIQRFITCCENKLDFTSLTQAKEYNYHNLPFCIIDSVFSIGVNYTSTENTVQRFYEHFNITRLREKELAQCKGKAFDVWLDQKNSKKHNHSTDQNKSTNHGSNALPIQLGSQSGSILAIVQNYKSITSRKINKLLKTPGSTIWHRNYYEDHPG